MIVIAWLEPGDDTTLIKLRNDRASVADGFSCARLCMRPTLHAPTVHAIRLCMRRASAAGRARLRPLAIEG
jgi:hypothetical protein